MWTVHLTVLWCTWYWKDTHVKCTSIENAIILKVLNLWTKHTKVSKVVLQLVMGIWYNVKNTPCSFVGFLCKDFTSNSFLMLYTWSFFNQLTIRVCLLRSYRKKDSLFISLWCVHVQSNKNIAKCIIITDHRK